MFVKAVKSLNVSERFAVDILTISENFPKPALLLTEFLDDLLPDGFQVEAGPAAGQLEQQQQQQGGPADPRHPHHHTHPYSAQTTDYSSF